MRRREFIAGFGSTAVWPVVARGQQGDAADKRYEIAPQFFPRDRSRNGFLQDRFVLMIDGQTFASSLFVLQCARCILSASKQCPYEATTSTRLKTHVVRSERRRTQ
jgi:hypothetical protein